MKILLKISITLAVVLLMLSSCTDEKTLSQYAREKGLTVEELESMDYGQQESLELNETYKMLIEDSTVADTVGGPRRFNNPAQTMQNLRKWRNRLKGNSHNQKGVLINFSAAFGLKTVKEMVERIDLYNEEVVQNGLDSITGIRVHQYFNQKKNASHYYTDVFLVPVTFQNKMIETGPVLSGSSLEEGPMTYNISNPCPDVCDPSLRKKIRDNKE